MFAALRSGWVYGPVYVKTLGCLSVPSLQLINQGNAENDKTGKIWNSLQLHAYTSIDICHLLYNLYI